MQSTPENQPRLTPNAFISDRSSESVQPELQFEGTFSYQELGSASSNIFHYHQRLMRYLLKFPRPARDQTSGSSWVSSSYL